MPHRHEADIAPLTMNPHAWIVLAIGFIVSFVVALAVVAWFMNWVRARGFVPFRALPDCSRHSTIDAVDAWHHVINHSWRPTLFFRICKVLFFVRTSGGEINGMQNARGRAECRPRACLTDQLYPALYLDTVVQRSRKISAKIPHRRCRRTTGHRAGGSGICFEGDGRTRDQRPLFWRGTVFSSTDYITLRFIWKTNCSCVFPCL